MYYNTVDGEPHGQAIGQSPSTQDPKNGLRAGAELALGYELTEPNSEIPYMPQKFQ
ncbi:hypothetical protein M422DRAFT_271689 [Sphaerobolus stellatus SS14]|uniref:Uncharacterized protein n=1 Tax=Sphaerobolus stellatus (strain SS14) TaxID=990650 RepID=A0A0C9UNT6_SPHS4|nr:hypothetical protein M422DRAFT_271952 [Sphaerobolus stellatus SS14]KIJ27198.1 hypothetical protein M422DRAFT_271689 [Sphaerobolus stellatus SS14]